MPQPHTITWSDGLHALAEADERAWLDHWARLHHTTIEPTPETPALLALTGSHR